MVPLWKSDSINAASRQESHQQDTGHGANSRQDIEAETWRKVQEPGLAPPWTRHLLYGGLTIVVPMLFNPLLFLFALQEEAARILAQQPVSVGTCAALKPPRCSECVRDAAWTSSVLPLAFSLLGISTF